MTNKEIMEAEANEFAMELLMPTDMLRKAMLGVDLMDDDKLRVIAKKFGVNVGILVFRAAQVLKVRGVQNQ